KPQPDNQAPPYIFHDLTVIGPNDEIKKYGRMDVIEASKTLERRQSKKTGYNVDRQIGEKNFIEWSAAEAKGCPFGSEIKYPNQEKADPSGDCRGYRKRRTKTNGKCE